MATQTPEMSAASRAAVQHWSMYGQRGRTPDARVLPSDWQNKPFTKPASSSWTVRIEPDQLALLLLGFLPMRNKGTQPPLQFMIIGDKVMSHRFMSTTADTSGKIIASEDKWFIFAEGPDAQGEVRLHVFRSWTGFKQIELVIDAGVDGYGSKGDGAMIREIIWETEEKGCYGSVERYKEIAREVLSWVMDVYLGPDVVDEPATRLSNLRLE